MNFSIEYIHENDLSITRLTDNNTKTIVDIIPQHGSILHAFTIQTPDGPLNVIDNYPDKKTILQQLPVSFKSAKLSPFACRVNMGRYSWSDTIYEFPNKFIDGSAIHGLLSDQSFTVVNQFCTEEKASVHLQYEYNRTDPGYPFNYTCEIIYSLFSNNTLQLETRITNKDTTPIPIADGWHPYFTLGGKINAYELQFTSDTMLEFNKALIPTGLLIPNASFKTITKIGDQTLDNCFQLTTNGSIPVCVLHNPFNRLSLFLYTDAHYPYLQIYTPDHRNSIAIENLSGAPDCFNNQMGLITLLPGKSQTFNVWYSLQLD